VDPHFHLFLMRRHYFRETTRGGQYNYLNPPPSTTAAWNSLNWGTQQALMVEGILSFLVNIIPIEFKLHPGGGRATQKLPAAND